MGEIWRRLVFLLRRGQHEQELEDELRFHAEMAGAQQFGNIVLHKEDSREAWGFGPLDRLGHDLRYALRILRKSPGFTLTAVLSLGLGIGANTAVFSLINAILLRPLPIAHPEELVTVSRTNLRSSGMTSFPYPFYKELKQRTDILEDVVCLAGMQPSLSLQGSAERVTGELVTSNYFQALGIQPFAGRLLQPDDDAPGANRVAVLSYWFWQRRFGGDRGDQSIIGKTIRLNTTPVTVVGISPPGYTGLRVGNTPDIRVPITMQAEMYAGGSMLSERDDYWLNVIGRLRPGIVRGRAEAALSTLMYNYLRQNAMGRKQSEYDRKLLESGRMFLVPAGHGLQSQATRAASQLYVLMTVVGIVLLIACLNLANLLLARTASRRREIAVRLSLGATRGRLVRQLLTESILLSVIGGATGVLLANWGAHILTSFVTAGQIGVSIDTGPDWRVLAFTLAISFATGVLFGLAPALKSTRVEVAPELKGDRALTFGTRIAWRKALVSAQIGLSLLLLIGSGLFLRSLLNLETKDPGFDKHHVLTISSDPYLAGYNAERARAFYRAVAERVSHLPGVLSATFARVGLVSGSIWGSGITVEGYQPKDGDGGPDRNAVGAGYFNTLRIPILRGRDFSPRDLVDAPHVAIVNERFAKFYFGNDDPIGKHIGPGGPKGIADFTIVGVAKDGKYSGLREATPRFWYIPYEQAANLHSITLFVRTAGKPEKAAGDIRRVIGAIDPTVPVFGIKTIEEQIDENLARDRMVATLSGFFAMLAAMIASIGLYGVMMYSVTSRTREIGIRMALGAQRAMVIGPIMRETAMLAVVGVTLGISCALGLARLVASLLFEMAPSDESTFISAGVLMTAVALAAGYLPARRAAQVDPAVALRDM